MISVAFVSFALFQFVGDPINNMVGQDATEEQRQLLREKLGLDKPWPLQFANFVLNISQGEFGMSYRVGIPVDELIATRLPATIELVLVSAVLSLIVGDTHGGIHRVKPKFLAFTSLPELIPDWNFPANLRDWDPVDFNIWSLASMASDFWQRRSRRFGLVEYQFSDR